MIEDEEEEDEKVIKDEEEEDEKVKEDEEEVVVGLRM